MKIQNTLSRGTSILKANKIVKTGQADLVAMGRIFINDPMWIYKSISSIKKIKNFIPSQYKRCF